jgi:hypothetical protein
MAQWTMTDSEAGYPLWSNNVLGVSNSEHIYGSTTEDAFITDLKVGVFGVDTTEMAYANTGDTEADAVPHSGWVLRKEGTGGRAGRVHYEVLVASGSMTGDDDANDTGLLPEEN